MVPLSTQVYKRNAGGDPAMDLHLIQGGIGILLVASCYRNRDMLRPDFTFILQLCYASCIFCSS